MNSVRIINSVFLSLFFFFDQIGERFEMGYQQLVITLTKRNILIIPVTATLRSLHISYFCYNFLTKDYQ